MTMQNPNNPPPQLPEDPQKAIDAFTRAAGLPAKATHDEIVAMFTACAKAVDPDSQPDSSQPDSDPDPSQPAAAEALRILLNLTRREAAIAREVGCRLEDFARLKAQRIGIAIGNPIDVGPRGGR